MRMAAFNARRRRKVASGAVRAGLVLSVVLITAFVLHHPVTLVLRQLTRLAGGSSGGSGSARASRKSSDGRSLTGTARLCTRLSNCWMCGTSCRAVNHISQSLFTLCRGAAPARYISQCKRQHRGRDSSPGSCPSAPAQAAGHSWSEQGGLPAGSLDWQPW